MITFCKYLIALYKLCENTLYNYVNIFVILTFLFLGYCVTICLNVDFDSCNAYHYRNLIKFLFSIYQFSIFSHITDVCVKRNVVSIFLKFCMSEGTLRNILIYQV